MTPEEQRKLAIECGFNWLQSNIRTIMCTNDQIDAYTAAVEATKQAELDKANARIAQLEEASKQIDNHG